MPHNKQAKSNPSKQRPVLLLVHGAWHGAWCWEDGFAPYLREQGHEVKTLNLPGHGQAGADKIPWYSIADYVDAVQAKLESIGRPTVVLGHSLGGYTVQKLMERRPPLLAGVVLLAAATQRGVWGVVGHLLQTQPMTLLTACLKQDLYHLVRSPERARQLFHLADLPEKTLKGYWSQIGNESFRAFLDMLLLNPISAKKADPMLPKLILGGDLDAIFPEAVVRHNASSYGVTATIYKGMPHSLAQNTGWQRLADDIGAWLNNLY